MSNEEKVRRLERLAAEKTSAAQDAKFVFAAEGLVAEFTADADILREAAQLMREQESLMTGPDWKLMYEAQKRDMAAMRKEVEGLKAERKIIKENLSGYQAQLPKLVAERDTAVNHAYSLRQQLREAQQQMAADAMLIAEAQRGAEIVADTERRLERRIAELQSERVALAWQNMELRGAVQYALEECVDLIGTDEGKRLETVLAIPPPDASAKVAEWKQKAEEFDGLMNNPAIRAAIYPLAVSALRAARGAK